MSSSNELLFIFDTNTLISGALIQNSIPSFCLKKVINLGYLCFSKETFLELKEVLERKKFEKYLSRDQKIQFFEKIKKVSLLVEPKQFFEICRDPKDNKFLDLAFESKSSFLITGDLDLLVLKSFDQTQIINPSDFARLDII